MIQGKERYDNIQVPDSLSEILTTACERAEHRKRKKRLKSFGVVAAAGLALMVLANNQTVYASLSEVPLLGSLVRVLHFGEGGERNDGLSLYPESAEETLRIRFENSEGQLENVPSYQIVYLEAPDRIEVTIGGIRIAKPEELIAEAESLSSVKAAYRVMYLDDSGIRFVLELERDIDYQLLEYKEPGFLELTFFGCEAAADRELFFLRTPAMEMGEALAILCEQYQDYGCSIVRTKDNQYTAVIGTFENEADALTVIDKLRLETGSEVPFQIDSCLSSQNPD